ncbi:site-specific recombinase XerD [Rhodoglobus vestalii]|uniref:Site-specific recombinase XerD n=1 Tax=Rhodoglobus vestalii TaxID=193384 RepID=A0A8H2K452_9MICO|nr:site-specific integrase [Rhodoglobus vestalii]TQO18537.1 site-specific recombinase XerD [Rhodoglobus vestalii]
MAGSAPPAENTPPAKKRKKRESFGTVRESSSKRYVASYMGPDGKRYRGPKSYPTKSEARAWLARVRVLLDSGDWNYASASADGAAKAGRAEVLGPYAEKWVMARVKTDGGELAPRTRKDYLSMVRRLLPPLSEQRIAMITPTDVREWNKAQRATGKVTQSARVYTVLRSIMDQAVHDGIIQVSPCKVRGAGNAVTGVEVKPPTATELKTILEVIDPRFKAMVVLGAWAALRFGEITELRRKDILIVDEGTAKRPRTTIYVDVSRGVTHVAGEGFILRPPKSKAGIRIVPLPPHVNDIVLDHLRDRVGEDPESLVYEAMTGGGLHLAASTWTDYWYPAREAAGRGDLHFHALRHFGATAFAQTGATIKELQDRLGHTTANVAMRYQHTTGRSAELAAKMSEHFGGEKADETGGKKKDKKSPKTNKGKGDDKKSPKTK